MPSTTPANASMETRSQAQTDQRELLLRLLPMTASLAGFCIAAITLFRLNDRLARVETLADDLLAVCALLFLLATYISFWALRTSQVGLLLPLSRVVDATFLVALSLLVTVGFMMVYNIL